MAKGKAAEFEERRGVLFPARLQVDASYSNNPGALQMSLRGEDGRGAAFTMTRRTTEELIEFLQEHLRLYPDWQ